jgi:hypothetical protein
LPSAVFTTEVAVANFSVKAVNAAVLFARTDDSGPSANTVATVSIPAMSAKTIPLPALTGDPELRNSFIVQSDGAPGSVYASIVSVGSSGFDLVEQIGKDQLANDNAGTHPWSLTDSAQDAVLLMFNHSASAKHFNVKIGNGGVLWQQAWQLAPMETRAVSIRELITDQVKDRRGAVLPKDLNYGEISWFTANPGEGKGRLLQVDRGAQLVAGNIRLARNFSCSNAIVICGGATLDTTSISFPFATDSDPLALGPLCPQLCTSYLNPQTCAGQAYGSCGSGYTYSWTSNNTSIATISGSSTSASAMFHGAGVGQGSATGKVSSAYCSGTGSGTPKVQTPTALNGPAMSAVTNYTGGQLKDCNGNGVTSPFYGWSQCASYTVLDQFTPAGQIKEPDLAFDEQDTVTDTNAGITSHTQSGTTDANYKLTDFFSLGSATAPPAPGTYVYSKQTITYGATTVRVNCLYQGTSGTTVTDITSNPGAACHH